MENYKKARIVEQPFPCPYPGLASDTPEVRVKDGSKIRNLMGFAMGRMEPDTCRQILFSGAGKSIAKAITCTEILKRRMRGLHQYTQLLYRTVHEVWEPLEPAAGLDSLTVSRNVPAICVLLSKDPLDNTQPGYQAPGSFNTLWVQASREEEEEAGQGQRRKRGAGRGKGGSGRQGGCREYSKKDYR
ncbi:ribonuclease P protein subunit p25-like protein [Conger conger]|uniref:ribonuclease P protein subunit p25-like protein n=1 Tax=Conger conger TaxID=82655 RepID=UPI002A5A2C67|nr:ribonuclease P protein subunit p25-like protein [Conger conger]XP_061115471.1 ribonuclease P protein subunit p25-like protein [Conger conger]